MKIADRVAKRLRNVTLKPIQFSASKAQHEHRISTCSNQETLPSPSILSSTSAVPFLSPPTILSFLPDYRSTFITSQPSPLRRDNETLEERAMRILGPRIATRRDVTPISTFQPPKLISSSPDVAIMESPTTLNVKDKKQLIENIQSCLKAVETARRVADELCQLYRLGSNCCTVLDHLFKVHATAFYLKTCTSAQIKAVLSSGLKLSLSDVVESINAFKTDVRHEQLFMAEIASARHIQSRIDSTTSIAMSSKLAYQLTKLSH